MVVFASVVLTIVLNDRSDVPNDPATGRPILQARERIDYLIDVLSERGEQILIPSPVLSEVLVVAGAAGLRYVRELQQSAVFRIDPFDTKAAIELAEITKTALAAGDKKSGVDAPWQLVKIDRQIVAIAKTAGAWCIYTNDGPLSAFAKQAGLDVVRIEDLPLRPADPQLTMHDWLTPPAPVSEPENEPNEAEIDLAAELDAIEDQKEEVEVEGQPEGPVGEVPSGSQGA